MFKNLLNNYLLLFICNLLCLTIEASYLEYSYINIELYHSLNKNDFSLRGNITITNLNSGAYTLSQESLTTIERNQLKQLAEENRFYRLQAVVTSSDGSRKEYLTSTRACALATSQLTDILWISLDHTGSVLGISQTVSSGNVGNCQHIHSLHIDELDEFNTEIYVKHMEAAPIPDTATFIQKLQLEREARERGETKDNRGFFAKYWMYIVPVVILVLISGATNPEATGAR
uniref:ER membrane protein complex subunit 10 n=1 Tax=Corethrella appendiculata TaxID=1370023 RepID=U5EW61_9DIPT